jgi:hypothetical protein
MNVRLICTLLLVAATARAQPSPASTIRVIRDCGRWRWDVKILADPDSGIVDFEHPKMTTIGDLARLRPLVTTEFLPRQWGERNIYTVTADLYAYAIDSYRDCLLSLRDPRNGATLVAAIPDPDCPEVSATPRAPLYRRMRAWLRDSVGEPSPRLPRPVRVTLTGVGIYDRLQNQNGMAENGLTRHPVVALEPYAAPASPSPASPPLAVASVAPNGTTTPKTAAAVSSATRRKRYRGARRRYRKGSRRRTKGRMTAGR